MAHSIFGLRFAIWQLSLFSISAWAQTVQEDLWNVPNGKLSDLSETFTNGQSLTLSWNAFATIPYLDTADNLVDLWVTAWPPNTLTEFSQLLTGNINLTASGGTFPWTIAIPSVDLAVTSEYVLRFKIASPTYDDTTDQLSSTGFIIQGEAAKTTTTSSSSLASSTSTSSPTSNTPPAQTSLTNKPGSSGLSGGAKAGIAIGVVVVVLGAAALVWFFFMAGRGRGMAPEASSSGTGIQLVDKKGSPTQPVELGETWQQQQQHAELQGDWQQHPSELPAR